MRDGSSPATLALLGLDVGTTTVKALLVGPHGEPLGLHVSPYPGGRTSDEPQEWWSAVTGAVRRLGASPGVRIAGIGVCGRGGGLALLDRRGEPVTVPWGPIRARAATMPLPRSRRFRRVAQWGRLLRALGRESPAALARAARILTVKDYVAWRLTGLVGIDPPGAACLRWPRAPQRLGVARSFLPPMRPPESRLGGLAPAAAQALGLRPGIPVAVGTHDGVAANVGAGMLSAGEGCVTLGTNAVVRVNTRTPVDGRWTAVPFTYPFVGGGWTSGGDVLEAGAAVAWLAAIGARPGRRPGNGGPSQEVAFFASLAALDALAEVAPPGSDGLRFVADTGAGATLAGLRRSHGPGHLARAIMEGVALALADVLESLERRGHRARELRLTGGGARSRVWPLIVAAALERPLGLAAPEASARGAAILAGVAAAVWPDVETAARRMGREAGRVTPSPGARRFYRRLRAARSGGG